jgi:hypothetical protein
MVLSLVIVGIFLSLEVSFIDSTVLEKQFIKEFLTVLELNGDVFTKILSK